MNTKILHSKKNATWVSLTAFLWCVSTQGTSENPTTLSPVPSAVALRAPAVLEARPRVTVRIRKKQPTLMGTNQETATPLQVSSEKPEMQQSDAYTLQKPVSRKSHHSSWSWSVKNPTINTNTSATTVTVSIIDQDTQQTHQVTKTFPKALTKIECEKEMTNLQKALTKEHPNSKLISSHFFTSTHQEQFASNISGPTHTKDHAPSATPEERNEQKAMEQHIDALEQEMEEFSQRMDKKFDDMRKRFAVWDYFFTW